mgnify:CR=1 FL=1
MDNNYFTKYQKGKLFKKDLLFQTEFHRLIQESILQNKKIHLDRVRVTAYKTKITHAQKLCYAQYLFMN